MIVGVSGLIGNDVHERLMDIMQVRKAFIVSKRGYGRFQDDIAEKSCAKAYYNGVIENSMPFMFTFHEEQYYKKNAISIVLLYKERAIFGII